MKKVAKKLSGLKIASYYGCLLTRPPKVATFDRIEDPQFLDNLVLSLGAESVNWAYKTECCGATFSLSKKELVLKLTNDILQNAYDEKADCIMVACPLCHSNLDLRQKEVEKKYKVKYNLPVFYFTQLIGLSMGADIRGLGLKRHMVSAEKLLSSKGLI